MAHAGPPEFDPVDAVAHLRDTLANHPLLRHPLVGRLWTRRTRYEPFRTHFHRGPRLSTDGEGNWKIYCPPSRQERGKWGVLAGLAAFMMVLVLPRWIPWTVDGLVPFLLWLLTVGGAACGLCPGRRFHLSRTRLRYGLFRTIDFGSSGSLGFVVETDRENPAVRHVIAEWGTTGRNQRAVGTFHGTPLMNPAVQARDALQIALHDGTLERDRPAEPSGDPF